MALCNRPVSCFIALKGKKLVGFACYDATALGYFGPMGIDKGFRNKSIGAALLFAALQDMKLKGYGYAIIVGFLCVLRVSVVIFLLLMVSP